MTAYLNPRLIANQGFALTPIALAVQGLLALLQEEQKTQVYGSGRRLSVTADWNTGPIREPLQGPSEDELINQVLEKWDAIERAPTPKPAPDPEPTPKPQTPTITPAVKTATVDDGWAARLAMERDQAIAANEKIRRERNAQALLLILSEL